MPEAFHSFSGTKEKNLDKEYKFMSKKTWNAPKLSVFGDVEKITMQKVIKPKQLGSSDDFGINGISSP
jgi:hypothetical protein